MNPLNEVPNFQSPLYNSNSWWNSKAFQLFCNPIGIWANLTIKYWINFSGEKCHEATTRKMFAPWKSHHFPKRSQGELRNPMFLCTKSAWNLWVNSYVSAHLFEAWRIPWPSTRSRCFGSSWQTRGAWPEPGWERFPGPQIIWNDSCGLLKQS